MPHSIPGMLVFLNLFFALPLQAMQTDEPSAAGTTPVQVTATDQSPPAADQQFLENIEPLLREHCYGCHSHAAGVMEGGLTLDWRSGWAEGGSRGPAVIPGNPDASLLIQAVRHQHVELRMPEEKLDAAAIGTLEAWVRTAAADPRSSPPQPKPIDADWWSLRPLNRPPVPANTPNPVDAFLQSAWARDGLQPPPKADRRTLIRRLTFELHGLLPTPEDTLAFVNDPDPAAFEKLVDRLLASPRYGERWARHWMDVIHFADSHGYEHDVFRPNAWRYRDYLISSLNADISWGQFIREQLAADVYVANQPLRQAALGFLGAGTYDHSALRLRHRKTLRTSTGTTWLCRR
ncbi:MAG UNVERIFIED_CONTAM: DUF1549 domain-containing protein [Planctomycetaceae bacterium]